MMNMMRMTTVFTVVLIALVGHGGGLSFVSISSTGTPESRADEYKELLDLTEDKDGLESIRAIHEQLDDDNDGTNKDDLIDTTPIRTLQVAVSYTSPSQ